MSWTSTSAARARIIAVPLTWRTRPGSNRNSTSTVSFWRAANLLELSWTGSNGSFANGTTRRPAPDLRSMAIGSLSSQQREPIEGLQPSAVICLGKRAASIVRMAGEGLPPMIVWNLAQAATPAVLAERRRAAAEISALVRQFFIRHKEVWA